MPPPTTSTSQSVRGASAVDRGLAADGCVGVDKGGLRLGSGLIGRAAAAVDRAFV